MRARPGHRIGRPHATGEAADTARPGTRHDEAPIPPGDRGSPCVARCYLAALRALRGAFALDSASAASSSRAATSS